MAAFFDCRQQFIHPKVLEFDSYVTYKAGKCVKLNSIQVKSTGVNPKGGKETSLKSGEG